MVLTAGSFDAVRVRAPRAVRFGSPVGGEAHALASDVDVPVVLDDANRDETGDTLHGLGFDVVVEYGPVVELHVPSQSPFEQYRNEGNPFIQNVVTGTSCV